MGKACSLLLSLPEKAFNVRRNGKGGKRFLQTYEQNGKSEQPLIIAICTPLLSGVHQLKQVGEIAFLDASGTLGRFCHHVCVFHVHTSPCRCSATRCVDYIWTITAYHQAAMPGKSTKCVIATCLWWQRTKNRSWYFLTDDDSGKGGALLDTWKEVIHCCILSNSCKLSGVGYLNTATT